MRKIIVMTSVIAALVFASPVTAKTGHPMSFSEVGGGGGLPHCGPNDFYTDYDMNGWHQIWTCLFGSWYYEGSW